MTATMDYGIDLRVQLGIGRQKNRGTWDASAWDTGAVWAESDTSLGDWVDVTCDTTQPFTLTAGASDADGVVTRWEAATCALELNGAQWDPWAGPYAGIVGPQVALRVSWKRTGDATWIAAFTGAVAADGWNYVPGARPRTEVAATDATQALAAFDPPERSPIGSGDTAAQRVNRILDVASWPANLRDVSPGGVLLKSSTMADALWTQLLAVADTDLALLWFRRDGRLSFRPEGRVGVGTQLAARLVICAPDPEEPPPEPELPYEELVTTDGAINYWRFDDPSGSVAVDQLGSLNASLSGALVERAQPPIAQGLGKSTRIWTGSGVTGSPTDTRNAPFTVEAWFYSEQYSFGGYGSLFSTHFPFGSFDVQLIGDGSSKVIGLWCNTGDGTNDIHRAPVASGLNIPMLTIMHIVVVFEPTQYAAYVNGVRAGSGPLSGVVRLWDPVRHVEHSPGGALRGLFSDVAVYPLALTAEQVARHYTAGMSPRPVPPVEPEPDDANQIQLVTIGGAQFADIRNIVSISRQKEEGVAEEPATVTVRDDASVARYLSRGYSRTDLQHQDDVWSTTVANAVLASSSWPSRAPREAVLTSQLADPDVPALLLSLEPDMTFDVEDTAGVLWREACIGWNVTVGRHRIDGTIELSDASDWVGGKWDTSIWDQDRWSYAVTIPALERTAHGNGT